MATCGNCGLQESATPKCPEEGACDCVAWTDATLLQARRGMLVKQTQRCFGVLDRLSLYSIARLDLADDPKAREALRVLARKGQEILEGIGRGLPTPPPVPECDWCEDTGILGLSPQMAGSCDCELGEALYA